MSQLNTSYASPPHSAQPKSPVLGPPLGMLKHVGSPHRHVQEMVTEVPKVEVQLTDRIVEVPQIQHVEKTIQVPEVLHREVVRHVKVPEIIEVIKEVPKVMVEYKERIVEVPQTQYVERIEYVPEVEVREVVKYEKVFEQQEVLREIPNIAVSYQERIVEVPHLETRQKIVEVPQIQIHEVVKHVHVPQIHEIVKHIEVPQVHMVEKLVEVPEVQVQEVIKHVPRVEIQERVQHVRKQEVQVIEKIVEVPHVQLVERIVEIPSVQVMEVVKHVHKVQRHEVVKEVPVVQLHQQEKFVEVPQIRHVEKIVEVPHVQIQEVTRHVEKDFVRHYGREIPIEQHLVRENLLVHPQAVYSTAPPPMQQMQVLQGQALVPVTTQQRLEKNGDMQGIFFPHPTEMHPQTHPHGQTTLTAPTLVPGQLQAHLLPPTTVPQGQPQAQAPQPQVLPQTQSQPMPVGVVQRGQQQSMAPMQQVGQRMVPMTPIATTQEYIQHSAEMQGVFVPHPQALMLQPSTPIGGSVTPMAPPLDNETSTNDKMLRRNPGAPPPMVAPTGSQPGSIMMLPNTPRGVPGQLIAMQPSTPRGAPQPLIPGVSGPQVPLLTATQQPGLPGPGSFVPGTLQAHCLAPVGLPQSHGSMVPQARTLGPPMVYSAAPQRPPPEGALWASPMHSGVPMAMGPGIQQVRPGPEHLHGAGLLGQTEYQQESQQGLQPQHMHGAGSVSQPGLVELHQAAPLAFQKWHANQPIPPGWSIASREEADYNKDVILQLMETWDVCALDDGWHMNAQAGGIVEPRSPGVQLPEYIIRCEDPNVQADALAGTALAHAPQEQAHLYTTHGQPQEDVTADKFAFRKWNASQPVPVGWHVASPKEIDANKPTVHHLMGQSDVCRLAGGWQVDGLGHGGNVKPGRPGERLEDLIICQVQQVLVSQQSAALPALPTDDIGSGQSEPSMGLALAFMRWDGQRPLAEEWRVASRVEVEANLAIVTQLLDRRDVCGLADGYQVDGGDRGNQVRPGRPGERCLDCIICQQAQPPGGGAIYGDGLAPQVAPQQGQQAREGEQPLFPSGRLNALAFTKWDASKPLPEGWRMASRPEVEANKGIVTQLLDSRDVCGLVGGWHIDGGDQGNTVYPGRPNERPPEVIICQPAVDGQTPQVPGTVDLSNSIIPTRGQPPMRSPLMAMPRQHQAQQQMQAANQQPSMSVAAATAQQTSLHRQQQPQQAPERTQESHANSLAFTKWTLDRLVPPGWRVATREEAEVNVGTVTQLLHPRDVCMLADGFQIDGGDQGNTVMKGRVGTQYSEVLICQLAGAPHLAGRFAGHSDSLAMVPLQQAHQGAHHGFPLAVQSQHHERTMELQQAYVPHSQQAPLAFTKWNVHQEIPDGWRLASPAEVEANRPTISQLMEPEEVCGLAGGHQIDAPSRGSVIQVAAPNARFEEMIIVQQAPSDAMVPGVVPLHDHSESLMFSKLKADQQLPAGWRVCTKEEAEQHRDRIAETMHASDTCGLAGGWQIDGSNDMYVFQEKAGEQGPEEYIVIAERMPTASIVAPVPAIIPQGPMVLTTQAPHGVHQGMMMVQSPQPHRQPGSVLAVPQKHFGAPTVYAGAPMIPAGVHPQQQVAIPQPLAGPISPAQQATGLLPMPGVEIPQDALAVKVPPEPNMDPALLPPQPSLTPIIDPTGCWIVGWRARGHWEFRHIQEQPRFAYGPVPSIPGKVISQRVLSKKEAHTPRGAVRTEWFWVFDAWDPVVDQDGEEYDAHDQPAFQNSSSLPPVVGAEIDRRGHSQELPPEDVIGRTQDFMSQPAQEMAPGGLR